jgi:magnesium and cobalt transporter
MNEDNTRTNQSWLERIGHALLGELDSREDLITLLRSAHKNQLINADAFSMIEGVLHISEMRVKEIMIPRAQMIVIEKQASLKEIIPLMIESAHSRFPVVGDKKEEIIGILLAKDLLNRSQTDLQFDIKEVIRPAMIVPENKKLDVLLSEFRRNRQHLAIVVDEYGAVSGMITIEDAIEQIVGNIEDEHDVDDEASIRVVGEKEYYVKASTSISEFNQYFHTDFDDSTFDTIAGLLIQESRRLPRQGDVIDLAPFECTVLKADARRLYLLKLSEKA